MKTIYLVSFILLASTQWVHGQAPHIAWGGGAIVSCGGYLGGAHSGSSYIVPDSFGNVYMTGYFYDYSIVLGKDTLINSDSTFSPLYFTAKYDNSGHLIWAKKRSYYGIPKMKANGNLIMCGSFEVDSISVGDSILRNSQLGSHNSNIYFVELDSSGQMIKAWNQGGIANRSLQLSGFDLDVSGNMFVAGFFSSGFFISKYNSSGLQSWLKIDSAQQLFAPAICSDLSGNLLLSSGFSGPSFIFDGDTLLSSNLSGGSTFFIMKFNAVGHPLWAKAETSSDLGLSSAIKTDKDQNIYTAGSFYHSRLSYDSITINGNGYQTAFILKCDSNGLGLWGRGGGGPFMSSGYNNAIDHQGNVYLIGTIQDSLAHFDNITLTGPYNHQKTFLAKYDKSGIILWVRELPNPGNDYSYFLSVAADNAVYLAGTFSGEMILNADTLNSPLCESAYFARLDDYPNSITHVNSSPITIHPNPSTGTFYFSGLNPGSSIDIYDLLGQHIYTTISEKENTAIDLSARSTGVYIYRISEGTSTQQGKIVKE